MDDTPAARREAGLTVDTARAVKRKGFSQPQRLTLVEDDLDTLEDGIASLRRVLVGLLVSVVLASVAMVTNVLVIVSHG